MIMPKKKNTWVSRLKKDIKTALRGAGHSPAGKKYLKKQKARGTDTLATKGIEKRLRAAGLTEKEIAKLR